MGLSCLPGSFTSRLLQDSLKERLWTRYQQITDRGTGPWPLGGPTEGALFPLTGLGSSTTEERTDAWGKERERQKEKKKQTGREGQKHRDWVGETQACSGREKHTKAGGVSGAKAVKRTWLQLQRKSRTRSETRCGGSQNRIRSVSVSRGRLSHLRTALSLYL